MSRQTGFYWWFDPSGSLTKKHAFNILTSDSINMVLMFQALAVIFSTSLFLGYLAQRFTEFQPNTAMILSSLILVCTVLLGDHYFGLSSAHQISLSIANLDFKTIILEGLLGYLLFAGALSIDFKDLKEQIVEVGLLALLGTIASTCLIGFILYYLCDLFGHPIPLVYSLLFGSLISPTDPIAVLATLKQTHAPKAIRTCIAGESLFNDGVGIVMFTALIMCVSNDIPLSPTFIIGLFAYKAVLGTIWGLASGYAMFKLINYKTPLTHMDAILTIAVVTATYTIAEHIHISGALAMVSSGLTLRHLLQTYGVVSPQRRSNLYLLWHIIDEALNLVLFFLIGFEVVILFNFTQYVGLIAWSILLCFFARFMTVAIPLKLIKSWRPNTHPISTITFGGLRGGLAIALALSIPNNQETSRELILNLTYANVLFSLLVQSTLFTLMTRRQKTL